MSKVRKIQKDISEGWAARLDAEVKKHFRLKCETSFNIFAMTYVTVLNPKVKDKVRLRKARAFIVGFMAGLGFCEEQVK